MVRIRLSRTGKRNSPYWKVGVYDQRTRRDGAAIEYLGSYDPHAQSPQEKLKVDLERIKYWMDQGAQPSKTILQLLNEIEIGEQS